MTVTSSVWFLVVDLLTILETPAAEDSIVQREALRCGSMLDLGAPARSSMARATAALGAWSALLVGAVVWGRVLVLSHHDLVLGSPPFFGPFGIHPSLRLVPAFVFAYGAVVFGPRVARRVKWRALLGAVATTAMGWAVVLAYVDGRHALTRPLSSERNDYLQTARQVHSLPDFLAHFVDRIGTYNQHTMGHPPGMVVVEWVLLRVGVATTSWDTAIVIAGGAAAAVAVLVALREVVDESSARAAAPFVVLVPAAIWWSAADAFYAGVSAWAVTMVVLATGRVGRRADLLALAGGVLFGASAFLSYGLVLLAVLPTSVAVARARARPLLIALVGALGVFAAYAAAGFSWVAGIAATRHQYVIGVAAQRPYSYFLFANLAVFAVAVGPAVAIALARLRDARVWMLVGSAIAVVVLADLSGMSKGEVERIWVPFVPWIVLSCCVLSNGGSAFERRALALQAGCAMVMAVTVWSLW
jgi:hypothetical protein